MRKLRIALTTLMLVAGLAVLGGPVAYADTLTVDNTVACDDGTGSPAYCTIQAAINAASPGDTINVAAGTYSLSSTVNVNKANLTLAGDDLLTTLIQADNSIGYAFSVTASGVTLRQLDIEKTDKAGPQNLIYIGASDVTIEDNEIHGQYVLGDSDVSRAMEVTYGLSGLRFAGNEIYSLRQPAYINGSIASPTTGTIEANHVYSTKGWVIDGANMTFTGNSWGTGDQANYLDIAILASTDPSYYPDIAALSAANNGAVVEDQRTSPRVLSIVYVDASAPSGGDGTVTRPYQTIGEGITRVAAGGTVNVAAGTYAEGVTLTPGKNLTIAGAGRDVVTWACPSGGYCVRGNMSGYTGNMNYEILGFTFNVRSDPATTWGAGIQIYRASSGPLSLSIHDNRFIEDRASGDSDHWGTSMFLCHNRYAARDGSGNAPVHIYNNIDETWGGMTMSNSQAYDIYHNVFDGCSDAIYNGHGCPDTAGQTFGDHHIYANTFMNASDDLHPGGMTPAIDWQYYGAGGGTHLSSLIENNLFQDNDTAMRFVMDTDMTYPAHVVTGNSFVGNGLSIRVDGAFASVLNASGNWFGTATSTGVAAQVTDDVDYTPWLADGSDTSADPGFQGDFSELWVDDDSPQAGTSGRIQEGIDTVSGSTVHVAAGTYEEQIVIDKPLTLRGATYAVNKNGYTVPDDYAWDDTVESIISGPNPFLNGILVDIANTDNVTFEGFVVQSLYSTGTGGGGKDPHLLRVYAHTQTVNNVVVRNNIIGPNTHVIDQDGTLGRMGLYLAMPNYGDYDITDSLFTGNKIFDCKGNGNNVFVWGGAENYSAERGELTGTVIEDNEIYGSHRSGIEIAGSADDLTIRNNKIYGNSGLPTDDPAKLKYGNGILVIRMGSDKTSPTAEGADNLSITGNEIFDNEKNGIYMGPINNNHTIFGNTIRDNGWDGIRIDMEEQYHGGTWPVYDGTSNIAAHCNSIYDNAMGAQVIGTPTNGFVLDAEDNWWGDVSGPLDDSDDTATGGLYNPTGLGNAVSDKVDYHPWAKSTPPCEPTAICLASFTTQAGLGSVTLAWETGTEVDNAGFNLYRASAADGPYVKVNSALIAAEGDPVAGASYSFLDKGLESGTYYYKLEDVDLNGVATLHGPVPATVLPRLRRPSYRPTLP